MRWSKGAARLSCDSLKAPSRRPQGALKAPSSRPQGALKAPSRRPQGASRRPQGALKAPSRRPQGALKAPSRRPQGALKAPWRCVEHRAAAVQAPYVSLAMLNFPGRPSHGDCEYHPFGYKYKYRDSCIAYHNHGTRTAPTRHPHGTHTAPARHPHGTRTTHLLTVGSPHDCCPATDLMLGTPLPIFEGHRTDVVEYVTTHAAEIKFAR